jgi:hypothetical protein
MTVRLCRELQAMTFLGASPVPTYVLSVDYVRQS